MLYRTILLAVSFAFVGSFAHAQSELTVLEETIIPPAYNSGSVTDLKEFDQNALRREAMHLYKIKLAQHQGYTIVLTQEYLVFAAGARYPSRIRRVTRLTEGLNFGSEDDCVATILQTGSFQSDGKWMSSIENHYMIPYCSGLHFSKRPRDGEKGMIELQPKSAFSNPVPPITASPLDMHTVYIAPTPTPEPTPVPTPTPTPAPTPKEFSDDLEPGVWKESTQKLDVSGKVNDILNKRPIAGAEVVIVGQEQRFRAVTNSSGEYKISNIPMQTDGLVLQVNPSGTEYKRKRRKAIGGIQNQTLVDQNFNLTPVAYTQDRIVFVLTWENPGADLDSQVLLKTAEHCEFEEAAYLSKKDNPLIGASLDKDDMHEPFGRETSIINLVNGKPILDKPYSFYVSYYNQENSPGTIYGSKAKVEIYVDGQLYAEVAPPTNSDRHWEVAKVVDGKIEIVNKSSTSESKLYIQDCALKKIEEIMTGNKLK